MVAEIAATPSRTARMNFELCCISFIVAAGKSGIDSKSRRTGVLVAIGTKLITGPTNRNSPERPVRELNFAQLAIGRKFAGSRYANECWIRPARNAGRSDGELRAARVGSASLRKFTV